MLLLRVIPKLNAKGDESRVKFLRIFTALIALLLLGAGDSRASEINFDKIPMSQTKLDFLMLYKTQWELFRLPSKLKQAVDDAFTEQTENLMWGTMRAQLVSNYDNIQEKIQQAAEYKFAGDYDKFLSELEDTFSGKLHSNILDFYKRQSREMYLELSDNPVAQAFLRQDYDRMTESNGKAVMNKISHELSEKYKLGMSATSIIGGSLMVLARRQLQKQVVQIVGRKLAGSALGKVAGAAIPVIGWAMLAWSAWDIYSMLADAEDTIKTKIFESYNTMYSEEVPLIYWDGMESYVRDSYIFAYNSLSESIERSLALSENVKFKELSQGLRKPRERIFYNRIADILQIIDKKNYTLDDILTQHGEFIRDSKQDDFEDFAAMLIKSDELLTKRAIRINELSQGLQEAEQQFFADKIARVEEVVAEGKNYTVDDVLTRYGEFIRDTSNREFDRFEEALYESDTLPENYPPKTATTPAIIPAVSHDISTDSPSTKTFRIHEGH